jgi:outer membrane protein OmpA-like peptidoglycan-associated protein
MTMQRAAWAALSGARPVVGLALILAGLCGCAASGPKGASLVQQYDLYERDASALDPPAPASDMLETSRSRRQALNVQKGDQARITMEEAIADARTASAVALALISERDADASRRATEQARRSWDDALRILTETEQVAKRTSEATSHEAPDMTPLSPAELPATTISGAPPPAGEAVALSNAWKTWLAAAVSEKVPAADLQERFEAQIAAASAGKKEQRALELYLAGRTLQELESRVRQETSRRTCAASAGLIAELASATDNARQATLELDRGLREDLRSELEKTREEAADRQNQLYAALQQIQGKYAQITRDARGTIISLADILFDFNKATLKREVEYGLVRVATILNQFPEMRIAVEGHTDNVGKPDYNLDLSRKRAQAVHDFLGSQGVAEERMTVAGYGMTRPVAENTTEEGRQKNRRVDLVVQD